MATQEKYKQYKQSKEESTDSYSADKKRIKLERPIGEADEEAPSTSASSFSLSIESPEGKFSVIFYILSVYYI